ncbi:MAG: T9SS type A sorting domain-containing protein, partial [Candidatus Delongbacteria bacterium]|nr:T9SS type A sorting domain-containing protein [Candidatus Delongbacteria bacterium]
VNLGQLPSGRYVYQVRLINSLDHSLTSPLDSFLIRDEPTPNSPPWVVELEPFLLDTLCFIRLILSEPASVTCFFGTDPDHLDRSIIFPDCPFSCYLKIDKLLPGTTYYFRLEMTDISGLTGYYPPAAELIAQSRFQAMADTPVSFTTQAQRSPIPPAMIQSEVYLHHQGRLGIQWQSDQFVTYQLLLYRQSDLIGRFADSVNYGTDGQVLISDLEPGPYTISLTIRNYLGLTCRTELSVALDNQPPLPPVISNLRHSLSQERLRVQWDTDHPASSILRWGRSSTDLSDLIEYKDSRSGHSILLNNVPLDQPVFYQVRSGLPDNLAQSEWSDIRSYIPTDIGESDDPRLDNEKPLSAIAFPNPFNGPALIRYRMAQAGPVSIQIYNTLGRIVRQWDYAMLCPGDHQLEWNGCDPAGHNCPSGLYIIRIQSLNRSILLKIMLMK